MSSWVNNGDGTSSFVTNSGLPITLSNDLLNNGEIFGDLFGAEEFTVGNISTNDQNYHEYSVLTNLGFSVDQVTYNEAVIAFNENPTPFGSGFAGPGFVNHYSRDPETVANVTTVAHSLLPGVVQRQLVIIDNVYHVLTIGIGTGIQPDFNEVAGAIAFVQTDVSIMLRIQDFTGFPPDPLIAGQVAGTNTDTLINSATQAIDQNEIRKQAILDEFRFDASLLTDAVFLQARFEEYSANLNEFIEIFIQAQAEINGTLTSGTGFDLRFGDNIADTNADGSFVIPDNQVVVGGVDELGNTFFSTAGELRQQVEYAAEFGISEDQVIAGQIDGGEDLNGPELVINLPDNSDIFDAEGFDEGRFAIDDETFEFAISPEAIFDPTSDGFIGEITLDNINAIGIEDTFSLTALDLGVNLPTVTFTDQFTQLDAGFNFQDTFLGSAINAGFGGADLALIGLGQGFGNNIPGIPGASDIVLDWNPTEFFGFDNSFTGQDSFTDSLFSTASSQGFDFETVTSTGFVSDTGQFFAPSIFQPQIDFGFNDFNQPDFLQSISTFQTGTSFSDPFFGNSFDFNQNRINTSFGNDIFGGFSLDFGTSSISEIDFVFPVVLDLDGDGIELDHLADAFFDFDGDGYQEQTTWASADDGLLVIDLNADGTRGAGDGIINQAEELAFSLYDEGMVTDLQALAEARDENGDLIFDTDGNSVLNANDGVWNELRIWQDADRDGRTDEGELRTLNQIGITTIGLLYDNLAAYDDTSDDISLFENTLHGAASYQINGQIIHGGVGDVSLAYEQNG